MKIKVSRGVKSIWVLSMLLLCHQAGERIFAQTAAQTPPASISSGLKFRPPTTSAPSGRVTGGSRGSGDATITLDVLPPEDTGITKQESPRLFWFQSKPANAKFELTLLQDNKVKPLVQVVVERAKAVGIQRLNLSDYGAKLIPGVEYQWVVALVTDPDNRS